MSLGFSPAWTVSTHEEMRLMKPPISCNDSILEPIGEFLYISSFWCHFSLGLASIYRGTLQQLERYGKEIRYVPAVASLPVGFKTSVMRKSSWMTSDLSFVPGFNLQSRDRKS